MVSLQARRGVVAIDPRVVWLALLTRRPEDGVGESSVAAMDPSVVLLASLTRRPEDGVWGEQRACLPGKTC